MFILQTFIEPVHWAKMFCRFICDQLNCFEETQNVVGGNTWVKPGLDWVAWGGRGNIEERPLFLRSEGGQLVREGTFQGWDLEWKPRIPYPGWGPAFPVPSPAGCTWHGGGGSWLWKGWAGDSLGAPPSPALPPPGCWAWVLFSQLLNFPLDGSPHNQNIDLFADFCFVVTNGWRFPLSSLPN